MPQVKYAFQSHVYQGKTNLQVSFHILDLIYNKTALFSDALFEALLVYVNMNIQQVLTSKTAAA